MVVALVTSPVLAVKVPSGTKLNATWTGFGTAIARRGTCTQSCSDHSDKQGIP
jgi:hypothetical protein